MTRSNGDRPRYLALSHDPIRTDPAFCALPLALQALEVALRRDGTRSACGVSPVRVGPWTRLAPGLTRQAVKDGLVALVAAGRCVVDWDEEEVYWHGYVSDQRGLASYRYARGVVSAVTAIQSPVIRAAVVHEMAQIPLDTVSTPTTDARFASAADRTRADWQHLTGTTSDGVSDGVSDGASIPGHRTQDTGHRTQDTGSSSRSRDLAPVTSSSTPTTSSDDDGVDGEVLTGGTAEQITNTWWDTYGKRSTTGRSKVAGAVAAILGEGFDPKTVHDALVHLVTVERRGVSAGNLRVAANIVARPEPTSRFRSDADALAQAAAALEGRAAS